MKATENDTVNEWNEYADLPNWDGDHFWQSDTIEPNAEAAHGPQRPIQPDLPPCVFLP
jgi:hypothetical protein